MAKATLGFVGTGLMGAPMCERLLDSGYDLVVWNRSREKTAPLAARGARVAATPREVGEAVDWIGLMLLDAASVLAVLEDGGLLGALCPGMIVANFSTIGPAAAVRIAAEVEGRGAGYLDCPVLGSTPPARSGKLLAFVSGPPESVARSRPILEVLAAKVVEPGPVGKASSLKLTANMLLARYVEALGEVFALARGFALDPRLVLEVLQGSALASPMWEKGKILLDGPAPVHFPLGHMAKDLRLLDEEVERMGLCLPGHEAVLGLVQEAEQIGLAGFDYSDLVRVFEHEGAGCGDPEE